MRATIAVERGKRKRGDAAGNIEFAWDGPNTRANAAKHGVTFEEAQTVFPDESARLIDDPAHPDDEERFILLGYSLRARCPIVVYCYRKPGTVIRLISARRATPHEAGEYRSFQ